MKKLKRIISLFLIIYLVFFQGLNLIWAQTKEIKENIRDTGQDYYLAPGTNNQLLIKVNVWGEVFKPGIVEVPDKTDLLSLISMAGGPTENAKLNKVKIVSNFSKNKTITINLKDYLQNGKTHKLPSIKPGDTVIVPRNSFHSISKYITFVYNLAVIASVIKIFSD